MICIGSHRFQKRAFLAPMAGISDLPFRRLCYRHGAGLCVSEMLSSKPHLWQSKKSQSRLPLDDSAGLRAVQLVGTDPTQLAQSARHYVALGAQIIDINMGCPAKKVCRKAAGSALMREPKLVADICRSVVNAVAVPVTLKIRSGWCPATRNALEIARIAEDCGIQSLVIHGRTRACRFLGHAEYDTIARVKQQLRIPVIANGDIDNPYKALWVLNYTAADGVMIGRGAQGNPWIFDQINQLLAPTSEHSIQSQALAAISNAQVIDTLHQHIMACHYYYGAALGVKLARKHTQAYLERWFSEHSTILRYAFNRLEAAQQQLAFIHNLEYFLDQLEHQHAITHAAFATITTNTLRELAA